MDSECNGSFGQLLVGSVGVGFSGVQGILKGCMLIEPYSSWVAILDAFTIKRDELRKEMKIDNFTSYLLNVK